MDETTLEALEYPAVLKELEGFAQTPPGRELVRSLRPMADISAIDASRLSLNEAVSLLNNHSIGQTGGHPAGRAGILPLGGIGDLKGPLKRLKPGGYIQPDELLEVKHTVEGLLELKAFLTRLAGRHFPLITAKADSLSTPRSLYLALDDILDEAGYIKDGATGRLRGIRNEAAALKERCRKAIEELIRKKSLGDELQDEVFTLRDDRMVLCVKAGPHSHFPGIVHGRSGSGSTYFIEPFETVDINNRIAILKRDEKEEEIEILKGVCSILLGLRDVLLNDGEIAAELDFLQAKAIFKRHIKGVIPALMAAGGVSIMGGGINIRGARHPILAFKEANGVARVVSVDILMGEDKKVLVISGANAGGKTVALKTLGLLSLMAQSGLPIPALEGSEARVFGAIFADIGDRQNIGESLSTFSAHLKRMAEILEKSDSDTLVLIDEIGVGTDPSEGGSLALAMLEGLKERGARAVVTTHLNLLKAHAQVDRAYENASVVFDDKTMRPLYTLRYGMPGPSLALSIASTYGIPPDIIERARRTLDIEEGPYVEGMRRLDEERKRLEALNERLGKMEEKRQKALERLRDEGKGLRESARKRFDAIAEKAASEIRGLVEHMKAAPKAPDAGDGIRNLGKVKERVSLVLSPRKEIYVPSAGDTVEMEGSRIRGVVLRVDGERRNAEMAAGNLKVWVRWDKLKKAGATGGPSRTTGGSVTVVATPAHQPSSTANQPATPVSGAGRVNLIGMRVEEAIRRVSRVIDDAHSMGVERIELVHGIGTGRLRKAIHEHLAANPLVKGFKDGDTLAGPNGVTVVDIF
ncbi:MAG: endonuclease MutS2 [Deltaproteobacteria bacterium]|nr:endonuclease MutS2 [Deltaproteobacteria bacterium]